MFFLIFNNIIINDKRKQGFIPTESNFITLKFMLSFMNIFIKK